jgi:hypothetical protein
MSEVPVRQDAILTLPDSTSTPTVTPSEIEMTPLPTEHVVSDKTITGKPDAMQLANLISSSSLHLFSLQYNHAYPFGRRRT